MNCNRCHKHLEVRPGETPKQARKRHRETCKP